MNSVIFRHLLGLLSSRGVLWDFQNFAEEDFANTLFAGALLTHIRVAQESYLDQPYWGSIRGGVTKEVAMDHLFQQLQSIGSEPPLMKSPNLDQPPS